MADFVPNRLLHATAAVLIRARAEGADRVAFIVHEFRSAGVRAAQVAANEADLAALVGALGGDPSPLVEGRQLAGPMSIPGSARVPSDVALYVGKAACIL